MRLFAISDLHLSFAKPKPMCVFGEHWRDHVMKIERSWRNSVGSGDLVLVAGDVSWAMKADEARSDIDWLDALPGRKLIVKGNHDYWFPSSRRKRVGLLGPGIVALHRCAAIFGEVGFVGTRGCQMDPAWIDDEAAWRKQLNRQLGHLAASVEALNAMECEPVHRIALLHYPPVAPGERSSPFTDLFEEAEIDICVYGHLHTQEDFDRALQGEHGGVRYFLTSADYLSFRPLDLTPFLSSGIRAPCSAAES